MSNTSHTPGPWKHSSFQVWAQGKAGNTFGTLVASLRRSPATDAVAEADANLIAAAPELLAACEEIIEGMIDGKNSTNKNVTMYAIQMVKSAIAKATQP